MTCNRLVIMYEGKILAADTPENLQRLMSGNSRVVAEIAAPAAVLKDCWQQMPEIEQFDVAPGEGDYFICSLTPRNGLDLRQLIYATAAGRGWPLRELTRSRHSLEDIFVKVTRPDREEEAV